MLLTTIKYASDIDFREMMDLESCDTRKNPSQHFFPRKFEIKN